MKNKIALLLILSGLVFTSCKNENTTSYKEDAIAFTKEGTLKIIKPDSTVAASLKIEIAETDYETETGLMYRKSMAENEGMLFIFDEIQERYFYMKNTNIPLDIIYIKADKTIGSIAKNAKPLNEESLPSGLPIQFVLEVNAGLSDKWNLQPGDSVSWERD
ncbi:DUF192 domain-containing protein [Leeuwenhoekiella sp. A16]|uniref:DUF192 domain-containing protein n=1 Tax=unclassified Leeuwenhoekiella TaxID=2615029 RepID=UPI003A80D4DE